MAITDELREFASHCADGMGGDALRHIADRIDREHRMAMEKVAAEADALPMTDESMVEHGWICLPLDADGVPIRIGDVVYDCNESPSEKFSVAIMELNKWGWLLLDSYGERNEPGQCYHHRAPTVEDVLREFGDWYAHVKGGCDEDGIVAEYAAKLRLAEEVDA